MPWNIATPLLHLTTLSPTRQAVNLFAEDLSQLYEVVPLRLEQNTLILAGPHDQNAALVKELQVRLHRPVRLLPCTWVEFKAFQARCYQHPLPQYRVLENEFVARLLDEPSATRSLNFNHIYPLSGEANTHNEDLERVGLAHYLPHLNLGSLFPADGLEVLLPEEMPREHFMPLAWVQGTLFCLVDDPNWLAVLQQNDLQLGFPCQWIMAASEVVAQAYQRLVLRGPSLITCTERQIVDFLVAKGTLTRDQGEIALQLEHLPGDSPKGSLIEKHLIREDDWLAARAALLGVIPLLYDDQPADFAQILAGVSPLLPGWIARKYHLLPLVSAEGTLLLGVDEIDLRTLGLAEALTHLTVEPRLMDAQEIERWLTRIYPAAASSETPLQFQSLLTEMGYLTSEQSREVFAGTPANWSEQLIEKGYLQEQDLVEALSFFCGLPGLSLDHFVFDEDLIRKFASVSDAAGSVLPLFENASGLWVAVTDPFLPAAFRTLAQASGKSVWPVIVPRSVLLPLIQHYHHTGLEKDEEPQISHLLDQLITAGVLTRKQAFNVLQQKKKTNCPLDQAIGTQSNLAPIPLAQALARAIKLQYQDLSLQEESHEVIDALGATHQRVRFLDPVDMAAVRLISLETAQQWGVLPVRFLGEQVVVAFADPLIESARVNLELMLARPVLPVLTARPILEEAIHRTLGRPNLGTSLLLARMITRAQLNDALEYAHKANIRLGRALVFKRYITEEALYQFLARQAHLPFFDLKGAVIDESAARLLNPHSERMDGLMPIAMDDTRVILATVDPLNQEGIERAGAVLQKPVELVLVTESDLDTALEMVYRNEYLNESVSALLERTPNDSAFRVLNRNQIIILIVLAAITVAGLIVNTSVYLIVLNAIITAFYLVFSIYKFRLIFKAISANLEIPVTSTEVAGLNDAELPVYSILVPVHHEAEVLADILKSLSSIDYPATRLDILVLLEEADLETIQKFDEINPPQFIQKVIVPDRLPKTKPKACNYGLLHARGDYVVIYDAEDLPDPDQLKKVVVAFSKAADDVACIQAKLNYYNRKQNILTEWFTVEYSMWFDLLLPGLDAERAPIPLGGTSNHFKTYSLIEAGAWDPYNVTEDADLGIRLFKRGYRTRIVDSTTYEEANSQYSNWIRQRSRWLKGYMQTWLVHMRHPVSLMREIGFVNFMSFQFIVGGTFLTALLNPVYWVMTAMWFLLKPAFVQLLFPSAVFYMGALCLYVGTFVFTYVNVAGAMRRGYYDMVRTAMLSPIYWAMSSIASWKGFFQLIFKPHFWEKTQHGLYQKPEEIVDPTGETEENT